MDSSSIVKITGQGPEPKREFQKLTQQEEVDKFLRFLHISPGEQFIVSLKSTNYEQRKDIWWHRLATVYKSEKNKLDFKHENNLVYGKRARQGLGPADGQSKTSQSFRDERDPKWKAHVYIKTSDFEGRGHSINDEDVKEVRCWWCEGDGPSGSRLEQVNRLKELEKSGLKFSAIVDSGGKSIHAFIRKPIGIVTAWEDDVRIMQKIAVLTKGDTSVITKSRCMRIPGFDRPGAESQKLLWGQEEIPFESLEKIEEVLEQILQSQGKSNWAEEYRALSLKDARKQAKQFAGGGELADQWDMYEVRPEEQIMAKKFKTKVDIKEFVPKDVKEMLSQGSLEGERNNDGLKVTLALAGAAKILEEIGLELKEPIEVILEDYAEASGDDFDLERLENQYAGAIEGEAMPSRTVESFMKTLNYLTGGMIGNQEIKITSEPQKGGMDGLLESIGPWQRINNDEGNECTPPQLNAGMTADLIQNSVADKLQFNDLTKQIEFCRESLPSDRVELGYVELQQLRRYCTKTFWVDSLLMVAYKNRFDPITDYLARIEQDEDIEPVDLDTLATTYLGTHNTLYNKMLKVVVLGAVKRRLEPGCQFDSVVVLHGKQGIKKSTFWKTLASPPWFCDTAPEDSKDFTMNIHSCWIFELGELDHITGQKDAGRLKSVITSAIDTIRLPYAKNTEKKPRDSIFVGSSNRDDFLKDQTGNRRFLIIPCPQDPAKGEFIDIKKLSGDRDKIWKAAIIGYRSGERAYLEWEMQYKSEEQNKNFRDEHPWGEAIERWLITNNMKEVTTEQIMSYALEISVDRHTMKDKKIVAELLKEQGWIQSKNPKQIGDTRKRVWTKGPQVQGTGQGTDPTQDVEIAAKTVEASVDSAGEITSINTGNAKKKDQTATCADAVSSPVLCGNACPAGGQRSRTQVTQVTQVNYQKDLLANDWSTSTDCGAQGEKDSKNTCDTCVDRAQPGQAKRKSPRPFLNPKQIEEVVLELKEWRRQGCPREKVDPIRFYSRGGAVKEF